MAEKDKKKDLVILGGGPGGYAAAFLAADLGLDVTLIGPEADPGGVCLYRGCIPTKALLHAAHVLEEGMRAGEMGIRFGEPEVDLEQLRSFKRKTVKQLTKGLGGLARKRKVEYVRGLGRFVDSSTIHVRPVEKGEEREIGFEKAIVATGAMPAELPGTPFDGKTILDSAAALEVQEVPERLLVVGAGYIGLELGSVYAALGSKVSVVEMLEGLLPLADRDLVREFRKRADEVFDEFILGTRAEIEKKKDGGVTATFARDDSKKDYDAVLVTVGRLPNTGDLGLENTEVNVDDDGFIRVDEQRRTSDPAILAIGDVSGAPLLAHKATHEGRTAAEVAAGRDVVFDPRAIPAVEYTEPQIAWTGLTESDAEAEGREVRVARFPWSASGRAKTRVTGIGLTKLIVDPETERVLGGGIVGDEAGELIAEITLAVEMAARVDDLALTIHPHPTLSETIMGAAEVFHGTATDIKMSAR